MEKLLRIVMIICLIVSPGMLPGCNKWDFTEDNFSLEPMRATIGQVTAMHEVLTSMPPPQEKVIVAVYKFRDQTGQYKTSATATTFSTAISANIAQLLSL